ncbi:MAG: glycosyltransferase family 4 protein [Chitinispirillaceae bacterium]|nr:glycosyltransferase family 4 protein [Chitinispirillaceae bacterium]
MVIGIDAREIQHGVNTGIGRALDNFLRWFGALDDEHRCVLFSEAVLPAVYGPRITAVVAPPFLATPLWDQAILPRLVRKHRIDLFFSPYYKVPLFTSAPIVSTIFDLMYIFYPVRWKGTGLFSRWYYRVFGGVMAAKAAVIFTCSEYSKGEIVRFYRVPAEKVKVIHLGLSDSYRPIGDAATIETVKRKFGIASPYLLYTGNFKPHKNVSTLIDAFEKVCGAAAGVQLVLAGDRDRYFDTVDRRIRQSSHAAAIIAAGQVSLDEQIALYCGAAVFVFPSLYEGFGYPPLEAMACGTPVVSSDRTSLGEIIGDAALKCNPTDAAAMAEQIIAVLQDADLRRQLSERGTARAQAFTNALFCKGLYALLLGRR